MMKILNILIVWRGKEFLQKIRSKKPHIYFNYSLYYFEVKCKIEKNIDEKRLNIGVKNCSTRKSVVFLTNSAIIRNEKNEKFKFSTPFNNNDIFGCGLVYPPTNKLNEEFPYVFFTQNGKQIGKGILLMENSESYKPHIGLKCCSVEANFGKDLESFEYDITKHLTLKEFC
uniref:Uncharacterized protein n=1 Tax=Meloidogyne enterolobii TaxID=390850 RepID=A0A6V7VA21_MELEN|nr:unnamed protein product [Meloidogyne enterolobii]